MSSESRYCDACYIRISNVEYPFWLQYWLYDFDAFIADVGGYLGLLLGQSLFGVYQTMSQCFEGKKLFNSMLAKARSLCKRSVNDRNRFFTETQKLV